MRSGRQTEDQVFVAQARVQVHYEHEEGEAWALPEPHRIFKMLRAHSTNSSQPSSSRPWENHLHVHGLVPAEQLLVNPPF